MNFRWPFSYGLTEMLATVAVQTKANSYLSCGRPLPGREIWIDQNHLIWAKGRGQFLYYWGLQGQVNPVLTNRYFATQDLGKWDEQGQLQMLGRRDDLFQCGGENVLPSLIERELLKIAGVSAAVVVPRMDPEYGAVPWAFIQSRSFRELSYYQQQLRERMPGIFIPRKILPFPPEIRPGPIKAQRALLKEYVQRYIPNQE